MEKFHFLMQKKKNTEMADDKSCDGASSALPPCLIVLGMAGSGKSSFVQRLASHLHSKKVFPYLVNLDPAAATVPFPANIDIRDTVNYKKVMQEYGLGPNGAILTSLNLFCTRFNQVLDLLDRRKGSMPYAIFDTPGQIEVFTWSASGTVITDSLAASFPTVVAYVMDSARSTNPTTFMSNMLYACSILYRTKLPFFVVLNKSDVVDPAFAVEWMKDFEQFQAALDQSSSSFMNDLTRSLSLVLDSFYENLNWVSVSAKTGQGFDKVLELIEKCRLEYWEVYKPMCERVAQERAAETANDGTTDAMPTEKLANLEIRENDVPSDEKGQTEEAQITETNGEEHSTKSTEGSEAQK